MKEIVSLIKLDFINIRKILLLTLIITILGLFILSLLTTSSINEFSPYIAGMLLHPSFVIAEKSGYNKLYGILPIKKHSIVISKFIFGFILIFISTLISTALYYISAKIILQTHLGFSEEFLILNDNVTILSSFIMASSQFKLICFFLIADYTILFIFGVSKETPAVLGFVGILTVLILIFSIAYALITNLLHIDSQTIIDNILIWGYYHSVLMIIINFIIGILFTVIGALISCRFFCKREL